MTRLDKARILEAYFENSISKEEMEFLLEVGIICTPIPWIFDNQDEKRKDTKKRKLIESVFGIKNIEVKWV